MNPALAAELSKHVLRGGWRHFVRDVEFSIVVWMMVVVCTAATLRGFVS
jgi:hypothetical protein